MDNGEFLKKQREEKSGVPSTPQTRHGNMNRNEFLLNKGILRDVNVKLRMFSAEKNERD